MLLYILPKNHHNHYYNCSCDFAYDFADAGLMALENHGELLPQETLELIEKNNPNWEDLFDHLVETRPWA